MTDARRMPHAATMVDEARLRAWPLPTTDGEGDKEERGRVLIVAGGRELPGAVILAGTAALRAGAGKVLLATAASVAVAVGCAVPEARVISLPEDADGEIHPRAADLLRAHAGKAGAVLIGPGCGDEESCAALAEALWPSLGQAPIVLDASAMALVSRIGRFSHPVLMTPHAGEMAHLCGVKKQAVLDSPEQAATAAAAQWQATVALKGSRTVIAEPSGARWVHDAAVPGLATSGSGDVLAGLIVGFLARGAGLAQAAAWGVALHARAGMGLAARSGDVGYLARELAAEVPRLMQRLASP
jgi:hydroxyethylthiazole kinase-like uncharacterized protein yjeF